MSALFSQGQRWKWREASSSWDYLHKRDMKLLLQGQQCRVHESKHQRQSHIHDLTSWVVLDDIENLNIWQYRGERGNSGEVLNSSKGLIPHHHQTWQKLWGEAQDWVAGRACGLGQSDTTLHNRYKCLHFSTHQYQALNNIITQYLHTVTLSLTVNWTTFLSLLFQNRVTVTL